MHVSLDDQRSLAVLSDALDVLQRLVDPIDEPQLVLPTPCDEFDVRRLLGHLIGWQRVVAACAVGEAPPFADGSPTYRLRPGRAAADLRHASTALVASLVRATVIDLPYRGPTDRSIVLIEQVAEMVIHTWDLARALGEEAVFDERTVAVAHLGLTELLGESFAPMGFRAAHVGSGAPADLDGLIARSGRRPVDLNQT
ncbi:maleylpyruvate isomerase family mycothiol-dependent enzyme [Solicola gregarius]|uniref:Maleylpyruvate isomerase family mycothiol-dependent enzyme n=1 Tax=Solicola gregarius TaxID=2908642 RepID=A0AA46YKV4_9ACTN|nr:maleylpyruvate isomerase family mycothiol-dependent enzyme [Solicola gregarius]UYM04994.1 maleylpyruvate isomerase family mycothiol-dependent enzyme [Solicola gregarius]